MKPGASSGAHFFRRMAGIWSSLTVPFVLNVKRSFLTCLSFKMLTILCGTREIVGGSILDIEFNLEFAENTTVNNSVLPRKYDDCPVACCV